MKSWFLLLGISLGLSSFGQNQVDAIRYSNLHYGGSARYNSMGGAFGALGGDLSSAAINPAGIGVYRSSEFSISTAMLSNSTNTNHYGNNTADFRLNLNFNGIGYVTSIDISKGLSSWQKINLAVGYNKIANFNNRYSILGINNNNSAIDQWVNQLNENGGADASTINNNSQYYQGTNLAWQNYLIDYDTNVTSYPYYSVLQRYGQTQSLTLIEKGSIGESFCTIGANYGNKLYIGVALATDKIKYNYETVYSESVSESDTAINLQNFSLSETISTQGRGYNAKIGIIFRPIDYLRLGASIQTPTYFDMSDQWTTDMESTFKDTSFYYSDPNGRYDYILITPYRATLSAGIQVGKSGLISADYEIIDYKTAQLQSENGDYDFANENSAIINNHVTSGNLKIGTEWRIEQFKVRAGYSYFGKPGRNDLNSNNAYSTYCLGLGFKQNDFYIDIAYNLSKKYGELYLYDSPSLSATATANNIHRITTSIGFRF